MIYTSSFAIKFRSDLLLMASGNLYVEVVSFALDSWFCMRSNYRAQEVFLRVKFQKFFRARIGYKGSLADKPENDGPYD